MVGFCIEQVRGRVPVIAGTGSNSTAEALGLTQKAKDMGADAALLISPYYNKPTQEGIYQHYKAVADGVAIPVVVYNCPGRTSSSVAPETVARLSEVPNIVALKDAETDIDYTSEVASISMSLSLLQGLAVREHVSASFRPIVGPVRRTSTNLASLASALRLHCVRSARGVKMSADHNHTDPPHPDDTPTVAAPGAVSRSDPSAQHGRFLPGARFGRTPPRRHSIARGC